MSLRFKIIQKILNGMDQSLSLDRFTNESNIDSIGLDSDIIVIYHHIAKKIPLIRTLIETNDCDQIIEINSMFKDLKSFIELIIEFLSKTNHNNRISELEIILRSKYMNEQIITYLQYLGMNKIFNKMYPLYQCNQLKKVTSINELKTVVLNCGHISYGCDKNIYMFEDHVWKQMNTEQSINFIRSLIMKHLPLMNDKMVQILSNEQNKQSIKPPLSSLAILRSLSFHCDPYFIIHLDQDKYHLGFDNGTYDLTRGQIVDGSPGFMTSYTVGYSYNMVYEDKNKLMSFLKMIVHDDIQREELLIKIAESLITKTCFVFSCERNNENLNETCYMTNKNVFIRLLEKTFGQMYFEEYNNSYSDGSLQFLALLKRKFVVFKCYHNNGIAKTNFNLTETERDLIFDNKQISTRVPGFDLFETIDQEINFNPIIDTKYKNNINNNNEINFFHFDFSGISVSKIVDQFIESCKKDFMLLLLDILKSIG